jgi:hypothetical protein
MTDFKKICLISNDDTTKPDQQTDLTELRRGRVLASTLRTIPRFIGPINYYAQVLPDSITSALNDITFFVIRTVNSVYVYNNNTITRTGGGQTFTQIGETIKVGNVDSIGSIPTGSTGQTVIDSLNTVFNKTTAPFKHDWTPLSGSGNAKLRASLTTDGKLRLDIIGNTYLADTEMVGLYFGEAPNGSTALGVTSVAGGVSGSAIAITVGNTFVVAPKRLGGL